MRKRDTRTRRKTRRRGNGRKWDNNWRKKTVRIS